MEQAIRRNELPEKISRKEFSRLLSMGFGNALIYLYRCKEPM